jgi:hypothetical protein
MCKWTSPILCGYLGVWANGEPIGLCSVVFWVLAGLVGVLGYYCCVLHHDRNHAIEFITIHEEPFPLPHYPTIPDLPCCFSGPNCTTSLFVWALKWCTCLIACQQLISITTEFLNLWQVGAYILTLMGNMMKMIILWWNKWPTLEVVMTFHCITWLMKPYLLYFPCRFQQDLTAVVQKLWTQKKQ